MTGKIVGSVAGAACLIILAACDTTYTPGLHHYEDASTGSHLSGVDPDAPKGNGVTDPSVSNNAGGPASYGGH